MKDLFNFLNYINELLSHLVYEVQEGDPPPVQLWTNRIPRGLVQLEKLLKILEGSELVINQVKDFCEAKNKA
jgi:hypothetical protein